MTPDPDEGSPGGRKAVVLTVSAADAGRRLDRILAAALPDLSRSAIQKAAAAGACRVDGMTESRPDRKLRAGQELAFLPPEPEGVLRAEEGETDILHQDDRLVVCAKPAGLTVHPCPSCPSETLIQRLLGRFPQLAGQAGMRPGIVHRLDRDTSGLILVALDEPARLALSGAFARREVRKTYLALVAGDPPERGEADAPLGRHPTMKVKMAVVPESAGGRPARSLWRRLWRAPDRSFALLAVRILTGRTHQIRVHMAHAGHPLLGDALYAPAAVARMAPRQMLHAWRLGFRHPADGREMSFVLPPPPDFPETALARSRRMTRLVLTGSPGCGKSAVRSLLEARGIPGICADAVVRDLYGPGGDVADWMRRRWGDEALDDAGAVDRDSLMARMGAHPEIRREIEALVHARVREEILAFWAAREAEGRACAAAEIPLYFECGAEAFVGAPGKAPLVAAVRCPQEIRFERLRERRGWSPEKCASIESWQWEAGRKERAADLVVDNAGGMPDLERACALLPEEIARRRAEDEKRIRAELEAAWTGADPWEDMA